MNPTPALPNVPVPPPSLPATGRRQMTRADWLAEGARRFGMPARRWKFVCPSCGTVQTGQMLLDAGLSLENVSTQIGFSCIGRHVRGLGCDWTLGGLLQIHTLEVIDEQGKAHPTFEFAPET